VVYPDGNKVHVIVLNFQAEITGGEPTLSNETTDFGWFSTTQTANMDMLDNHHERILETLQNLPYTIIK
jgi:hypothetical protein